LNIALFFAFPLHSLIRAGCIDFTVTRNTGRLKKYKIAFGFKVTLFYFPMFFLFMFDRLKSYSI